MYHDVCSIQLVFRDYSTELYKVQMSCVSHTVVAVCYTVSIVDGSHRECVLLE